MNISKTFFSTVILTLAGFVGLKGQSAVLTSGGDASGTGGKAAYSVGQVAYISIPGEAGLISLGVQQAYEVIMVGTSDPAFAIEASVFPNPASSDVYLKLEIDNPALNDEALTLDLFDVSGKLMFRHEISDAITTIPLKELTGSVYLLRVTNKHSAVKTFKIFKTN